MNPKTLELLEQLKDLATDSQLQIQAMIDATKKYQEFIENEERQLIIDFGNIDGKNKVVVS